MRVGTNPLRRLQRQRRPAPVTVVTVTHIPFLAGYYAQSLDVLKSMLASLRANTEEDHDLFLFDNASCSEVQDYLLEQTRQGVIQCLLLSDQNVGKLWSVLLGAAPGEYVAFVDSDMYFHPGWLTASLKVIETFPEVGLVTTMPARHMSGSFTRSTLEWARSSSEVSLEEGHLLQPDWIADYCEGFGLDVNEYLTRWNGEVDYRLTYKGITAFVGAVENQFLGRKSILEKIVPPAPSGWVMHQGSLLYENLDAAGYLTLATDGLYVHHLGNTLTPKWRAVAEKLGLTLTSRGLSASDDWASKLAKSGLARRVLLKSYDGLFRLLYRGVA